MEDNEESTAPINKWFDEMMDNELSQDEQVDIVQKAAQEYEDASVIESEISRVNNQLQIQGVVNRQVRVSIESYINEDDDSLPSPLSYTEDGSRVNYDATVTWIDKRNDEALATAVRLGVGTAITALKWISRFGFDKGDGDELAKLSNESNKLFLEHIELAKEATLPPKEAIGALHQMITSLGMNPDETDISFLDNESTTGILAPKKKMVLTTLGCQYLSTLLDPFVTNLTISTSESDGYKSYMEVADDMLLSIIKSLKAGAVTGTAVAAVTPKLDEVEACSSSYVQKIAAKGTEIDPTFDDIEFVINTVVRLPLLISLERDVMDKLVEVSNLLTAAYNLTDTIGESTIDVKQPNTMLSVLDDTVAKLLIIVEATQVRHDVYTSVKTLLEGKVRLYKAYSVYLSCLAE